MSQTQIQTQIQTWTKARSKIGFAVRAGADQATVEDLRRDLRAAQLAKHISDVAAALPPLTDEQRATLAALLTGGEN